MKAWDHQIRAAEEVQEAIRRGERRIVLCSPTGGGKTRIACDLIDLWTEQGLKTILYSNRKMLVEQTGRVLAGASIDHGKRAAGWEADDFQPVQVSSIQTEHSRVMRGKTWELYPADRVLVDEAHCQVGPSVQAILQAHHDAGAAIVGLTATPIGLGGLYTCLIQAGTTSELRECGALVWCHHFGPDEPDLRAFIRLHKSTAASIRGKLESGRNLSESELRKLMPPAPIFGRVWEWFHRLNADHKPTILFGPDVGGSIYYAERFTKMGVTAAHIDGENIWINGKLERSTQRLREQVLEGSKNGLIKVLCNRFVLREGVDAPWLAHGIFATVFGSLQSYLQSGGRLLRSFPGNRSVTLQDHGGNWWRHGSLNADRVWRLDHTASMIAGLRADRLRNHVEREPFRCPQCGLISIAGRCRCGWQAQPGQKKSRPVISTDGTLVELHGDIYRPRRICQAPNGPALWERMYHRSRTAKGSRTFRAAMALFAQENYWQWPSTDWPLMPVKELDFYRLVADVPASELVPPEAP